MNVMNSAFWRNSKGQPHRLPDGRRSNAYFEYAARKAFERYCKKGGLTPYTFVEFESVSTLNNETGRATYEPGLRLVEIAMDTLKAIAADIEYKNCMDAPSTLEGLINDAVAHEIAHIIIHPKRGHSEEWKKQMAAWGFLPILSERYKNVKALPHFARTKGPPRFIRTKLPIKMRRTK